MQDRTKLILWRSALLAGILSSVMTIVFVDAGLTKFDQLADVGTSEWLSFVGDSLIMFVTMFITGFLMIGFITLLFVAVGRYIYDRFYRTPVL